LFALEDTVQDLFFETITFRRIALVAKLMATAECTEDEKDVALAWLGEMTKELGERLNEYEKKHPLSGGDSDSRGGFQ
jgi:hypothetical protein